MGPGSTSSNDSYARVPITLSPRAMQRSRGMFGHCRRASSRVGQRADSKNTARTPAWFKRYSSSAAVLRHERLTADAPMRAMADSTSKNSGRFQSSRAALSRGLSPKRSSPVARRSMRASTSP